MNGKEIKELRQSHGITQTELAQALNIPAEVLSLIETGKVLPTPLHIQLAESFFQEKNKTQRVQSGWKVVTSVRRA